MTPTWIDRTISAPSENYLTSDEFGRLFGLSGDTVDRLTKSGDLPEPVRVSKQTKLYTWEHAVYYALKLKFNPPEPDLGDGVKGKGRKEISATGG